MHRFPPCPQCTRKEVLNWTDLNDDRVSPLMNGVTHHLPHWETVHFWLVLEHVTMLFNAIRIEGQCRTFKVNSSNLNLYLAALSALSKPKHGSWRVNQIFILNPGSKSFSQLNMSAWINAHASRCYSLAGATTNSTSIK